MEKNKAGKHGKLPKVNEKANKSDFIFYKAKIVKTVKWKQDFPLGGVECQGNLRRNLNISNILFAYLISPRTSHEMKLLKQSAAENTSRDIIIIIIIIAWFEGGSEGGGWGADAPPPPPALPPRQRSSRGLVTRCH